MQYSLTHVYEVPDEAVEGEGTKMRSWAPFRAVFLGENGRNYFVAWRDRPYFWSDLEAQVKNPSGLVVYEEPHASLVEFALRMTGRS